MSCIHPWHRVTPWHQCVSIHLPSELDWQQPTPSQNKDGVGLGDAERPVANAPPIKAIPLALLMAGPHKSL
ncbi:hypothetical protein GFS31_36940 [Leptolyngbya sp. BL0902]|nr:hypothetical protein GFS31_36940 [Leptolyngbya sp. BL0902]